MRRLRRAPSRRRRPVCVGWGVVEPELADLARTGIERKRDQVSLSYADLNRPFGPIVPLWDLLLVQSKEDGFAPQEAGCRLHLNRSAAQGGAPRAAQIKMQKFRPLNALISGRARV
jgi:hypothetical protein